MGPKYQTLSEFIASPFGRGLSLDKDTKFFNKYQEFIRTNKVRLAAITEIEGAYYYLIKIPSETNKDRIEYDVVIRFFGDDQEVLSQNHLRNYKIQFFSNCPSFTYQYAYIYLKEGYGIEFLYDKLDKSFKTTPPTNSNPNNNLVYDKSIYYACKFLQSNKFHLLGKNGPATLKKVLPGKFFSLISSFSDMKFDIELANEERRLKREVINAKDKDKFDKRREANSSFIQKKHAVTQTARSEDINNMRINKRDKIKPNRKISSRQSTFDNIKWNT